MQSYERYALVTLLFLVVLVVVVALWDDGTPVEAAPRSDAPDVTEVARVEHSSSPAATGRSAHAGSSSSSPSRGGGAASMPLAGVNEIQASKERVTTIGAGDSHRVDRFSETVPPQPQAQDAYDQLMRPVQPGATTQPASTANTAAGFDFLPRPTGTSRGGVKLASVNNQAPADANRVLGRNSVVESTGRSTGPKAREASVSTAPKTPKTNAPSTYTVVAGDSLSTVAGKTLGSSSEYAKIASLNGLNKPYTIYVGQVLRIPTSASSTDASTPAKAASAPVSAPKGSRPYTVRSGDILSVLLERELGTYKRSITKVLELNPGMNPDRLVAGKVILLPKSVPGAQPKKPSSSSLPQTLAAPKGSRLASAAGKDSEFVVR